MDFSGGWNLIILKPGSLDQHNNSSNLKSDTLVPAHMFQLLQCNTTVMLVNHAVFNNQTNQDSQTNPVNLLSKTNRTNRITKITNNRSKDNSSSKDSNKVNSHNKEANKVGGTINQPKLEIT